MIDFPANFYMVALKNSEDAMHWRRMEESWKNLGSGGG